MADRSGPKIFVGEWATREGTPTPNFGADPREGRRSSAADNGNGTYSNPLSFGEFSDPDIIRGGSDFYLTGTTMHTMPGLAILHSRDLVNWTFWSSALP